MAKKRALSGIQTSGNLHIGNYIGALKRFVAMQDEYESYYFLADLHAITVPQDPEELRRQIRGVAEVYLASGLDPEKAVIFRQSDVPAHAELGWMLTTISTMGELSRMTQFKDKAGTSAQDGTGAGLFAYPSLMAADILLYQPDVVPVGDDQKQHVELTRNLAGRFNQRFGNVFTVPKPLIAKQAARIMGLDDPSKKMSKSAPSELNYISLNDSSDTVRKKVRKAVTDSGDDIKAGADKPAVTNLLTIFSEISDRPVGELEKAYAGKGYGDFKNDLGEALVAFLEPIQKKLAEYERDPAEVDAILARGAEKARPIAERTLAQAKQAMGLA